MRAEFQIEALKPAPRLPTNFVFSLFDAKFEDALIIVFSASPTDDSIHVDVRFDDFSARKSRALAGEPAAFQRNEKLELQIERTEKRQVAFRVGKSAWRVLLDELDPAFEPRHLTVEAHSIEGWVRFIDEPIA